MNSRPFGLLSPLPIPTRCWEYVSLDFMTDLPRTRDGHDAIVVFVDKLSKMIHSIPTTTSVTAPKVADIFFKEVVAHHGVPTVLVSDRDPRFDSHFWGSLFTLLGTTLNMSTSRHPQTDGQTERANRTI